MIWAVQVLSPSTCEEARFEPLVDGLLECDFAVICCPTGAWGMRQLRSISTPTHNSIARVLEFVDAGVPVRLGSGNIVDMCSPNSRQDGVSTTTHAQASESIWTETLMKLRG